MPHPSFFRRWIGALQIAALLAWGLQVAPEGRAQTGKQDSSPYALHSTVSEVGVTFRAVGKDGVAVNDLRASEIEVFDDRVQARIVGFYAQQDRPIRAGIILDTSESMEKSLTGNRAIAAEFVQTILRQQKD